MPQLNLMDRIRVDINKYQNRRDIIRAGIVERLMVRKVAPEKLHPNPVDEFTHPDVGPNYAIISDYAEQARHCIRFELEVFEEPIIVEKVRFGGYMILNGHHRWAAALQASVPKVCVSIVNQLALDSVRKRRKP